MTRFSIVATIAIVLVMLIVANSQSRKPWPPNNRPPLTETRASAAVQRVKFRCAKNTSTSALMLDVRNEGPDRVAQATIVYYYYRTPASDMSITGSQRLEQSLDKGGIFSIRLGDNSETKISECGCSLRRFFPSAKTTQKAG